MPCLEVLRAVTDKNINGEGAKQREEAFSIANELMAESNLDILIPFQMFERVSVRLNDDHKTVFETLYRIDKSTKDIPNFDLHQAVKLLASAESKARPVIILTDNYSDHKEVENKRIRIVSPEDFIKKIKILRHYKKKGVLSSFEDALNFVLFKE